MATGLALKQSKSLSGPLRSESAPSAVDLPGKTDKCQIYVGLSAALRIDVKGLAYSGRINAYVFVQLRNPTFYDSASSSIVLGVGVPRRISSYVPGNKPVPKHVNVPGAHLPNPSIMGNGVRVFLSSRDSP